MEVQEKNREVLLVKRDSGVVLVILDSPGKVNTLSSTTNDSLGNLFKLVSKDKDIKGLILISGKPDTFVIGADLFEIRRAKGVEDIQKLCTIGHTIFNDLSKLPFPTVAAINGACLGGGLELALSCSRRIATDNPATIIGLPETRLGLIPGLGGTQRLPRLIGLKSALEIILTADPLSSQRALEMGIVDKVVPANDLIEEAEKLIFELEKTGDFDAFNYGASRNHDDLSPEKSAKLFAITERSLRIKTKGNYPAQTMVIDAIKTGLEQGMEAGLKKEQDIFSHLAMTDVSANLISLFFNTDFARQSAISLARKFPGSEPKSLGIAGSGLMGTSIAALAANHGLEVFIKVDEHKKESTIQRFSEFATRYGGKQNKATQAKDALERLHIVPNYADIAQADLIIECVLEEEEVKLAVLSQLDSLAPAEAVIATNTSSLSLSTLANSLKSPERFVGIHFFHPVDRMPLVEVIALAGTNRKSLARAVSMLTKMDKTPLVVKDGPGFLINRLLTAFMIASARLVDQGIPLNWIDEVALEYGMPLGPWELVDEIGWNVGITVSRSLHERIGNRMAPPKCLVLCGQLGLEGKKGGAGNFLWNGEKKGPYNPLVLEQVNGTVSEQRCPEDKKQELTDKLFLPMVDEAAYCLEEKIVAKPRDIDMAIILGIGFPAFRGGLLRYADKVGLKTVLDKLTSMYAEDGTNRKPCDLIRKYVDQGRSFYSLAGGAEE